MNEKNKNKTNYITGYTGFDDVPDSIRKQSSSYRNNAASNSANGKKNLPSENSLSPSRLAPKTDSDGLTAAQRYMREQQRAEARARAEAAARKAGVKTNAPGKNTVSSNINSDKRSSQNYHSSDSHNSFGSLSQSLSEKLPPITLNFTTFLVILSLILLIFTFVSFNRIKQNYIPEVSRESVMDDLIKDMEPELKAGYKKIEVSSENMYSGELILVNSDSKYVFNNSPSVVPAEELAVINSVKTSKNYKVKDFTVKLNKSTIEKLDIMFNAFYEISSKGDVMISAGYRSTEDQQRIYDQKVEQLGKDQKIAVLPGASEHHSGYAMDFNIYTDSGITHQFNGDGDYTWLAQNAHKYGFVLRYPEGKENITGVDFEPWHYRYVGIPHAYYLYSSGKTLEEYITLVKNYPCDYPLYVTDWDGSMYIVYYKKSDGAKTQVPVPENGEYSISGNNVDGYIVTVKESAASSTSGYSYNYSSDSSGTSSNASSIQIPSQNN